MGVRHDFRYFLSIILPYISEILGFKELDNIDLGISLIHCKCDLLIYLSAEILVLEMYFWFMYKGKCQFCFTYKDIQFVLNLVLFLSAVIDRTWSFSTSSPNIFGKVTGVLLHSLIICNVVSLLREYVSDHSLIFGKVTEVLLHSLIICSVLSA